MRRKRNASALLAAAAGATLLGFPGLSHATTYVWFGTTNGNMNGTPGNYSPSGAPVSGDIIQFTASSYANAPTMNGTLTIGGLWFAPGNTTGVTIGGTSALTINDTTINGNAATGLEMDSGSGAVNISAPIILGNNQTWINNSVNMLTTSGAVTAKQITFTGTGSFTLSGTTDDTGASAVVSSGTTLILGKTSSATVHALNTAAGTLALDINSGATAQLSGSGGDQIFASGSVRVNGTLDMHGLSEGFDGLAGSGNVSNSVAATSSVLTLGQNNSFGTFTTFSGNLLNGNGTLNLIKTGTGTEILTGSNSYTGVTNISGGILQIGSAGTTGSVGSGAINITGFNRSAGQMTGLSISLTNSPVLANDIKLITGTGNNDAFVSVASGDTATLNGTITSTGAQFWAGGAGTLILNGSSGSYTQGMVILGPTVEFSSLANIGTGGVFFSSLGTGGTLEYTGTTSISTAQITGNMFQLGNSASTINVLNSTASLALTAAIGQSVANAGFTKAGAGTLILSGPNTFAGAVNVSAGTVLIGVSNTGTTNGALGIGAVNLGINASTQSASLLTNGAFNFSNAIKVGTPGTGATFAIGGNTANTSTFSGAITPNGGLTLSQVAGGNLNVSGAISSGATASTLTFAGPGNINITNTISDGASNSAVNVIGGLTTFSAANSYTGPTNISGGTLVLANSSALGQTNVTANTGGTLLVKGNSTIGSSSIGSLSIAGGAVDLRDVSINTLSVSGNLSVSNGSVLDLDLGNSSGSNDALNIAGTASISGISTINLNELGTLPSGGSTFTLITAAGGGFTASASGSATGFVIGNRPAGFNSFTLSDPDANTLLLTVVASPVPGTAYWTGAASVTGGDTGNNWGFGTSLATPQSNWSTDSAGTMDALQVPGSITNVFFTANNAPGGAVSTQLDSSYSINSLTFDTSTATHSITSVSINTSGNILTLGSGGLTVTSTDNSSTTINGVGTGIVIGTGQNWANNNAAMPLTINTGIGGASGANTLTINGTGSGGVILNGPISDGIAGGTLALNLNQAGITQLNGSNSYSGGTTINSGTVRLGNNAALGSPAGLLTLTSAAVVDLQSFSPTVGGLSDGGGTGGTIGSSGTAQSPVFTIATTGSSTFSGVITNNIGTGSGNSVSLVVKGTGTETLSGLNTYSGNTTINSATLQLGVNNALPVTTTLNLAGTGSLNLNGNAQSVAGISVSPGANATLSGGTLNLDSGSIVFTATAASTSNLSGGTISINGATIDASAAGGSNVPAGVFVNVNSQITGTGGLTIKAFGGTADNGNFNGNSNSLFTLGNMNNNFTGGVNIASGLVNVNAGDPVFGNGNNPLTNLVTIAPGAGVIDASLTAFTTILAGNFALAGPGNHFVRVYSLPTLQLNGVISGTDPAAGLRMIDGGTTVLAGSNTYTGVTSINDGTVYVTGNESAATGGWIIGSANGFTTTVNFNSGSSVSIAAGNTVSIGTLPAGIAAGSLNATLNVATTVTNAGSLNTGRAAFLNINNGGNWTQSGPVSIQPLNASGFGTTVTINTGGLFSFNGSTAINLTPTFSLPAQTGQNGSSILLIAGGTFNTSQGFADAASNNTSSAMYSYGSSTVSLTNGGTLNLTADVPNLATTAGNKFNITVGNGSGGIINTNGFNASISVPVTNVTGQAGMLTKTGLGTLAFTASNTYTGGTNVLAGAVSFAAPGALPNGTNLNISAGAQASAALNTGIKNTIFVGNLNLAGGTGNWTALLDLSNNDMIARGDTLATVNDQVTQGFNGGNWNGTGGIVSTAAATDPTHLTALGVIQNSVDQNGGAAVKATFDGQSVLNTDILVKYTYYGDANLDGAVDSADYSRIDNAFLSNQTNPGTPLTGWFNGDFNYDGTINGSDYTLIDNAFNMQGAQLSSEIASPTSLIGGSSATSAVPEPASLGLLGIGMTGLLTRRRRR